MAGRKTVYNDGLTDEETWEKVNKINKRLVKDFNGYCRSTDKSPATIFMYESILKVFFCWNYRENENKSFIEVRKRDLIIFFGWGKTELGWSPNRVVNVRSVLSTFSNYIERILDDEYPTFKNLVKILEPIHIEPVREKTVLGSEEIEQLIDQLVEEKDYQKACWLALMYSSGMRKAEVAQMMDDFFVPENIVFDIMYRTPKIRTKGRGVKGKVVSRYVFTYTFQRYLELWREERKRLGITLPNLFVVKKGDRYEPAKTTTFNSWAQGLSNKTGKDIYCHAYRHAWTTSLAKKGYPTAVIQKLQQWSTSDMVGRYTDTTDEEELGDFFKQLNKKDE